MFGFTKKSDKRGKKQKKLQASCTGKAVEGSSAKAGKNGEGQSLAGDALRAQALANARAARAQIGDETIQRIAAAMAKKETNPMAMAKKQLESADSDRVCDEILYMLDQK